MGDLGIYVLQDEITCYRMKSDLVAPKQTRIAPLCIALQEGVTTEISNVCLLVSYNGAFPFLKLVPKSCQASAFKYQVWCRVRVQ